MTVNEMVRLWKDPEVRWESGAVAAHPAGEIVLALTAAREGAQADITWTTWSTASVTCRQNDRI